jgi:uncharacterized membrane protein
MKRKVAEFLKNRWDVLVVLIIAVIGVDGAFTYFNLDRYYSASDVTVMTVAFVLAVVAAISIFRRIAKYVRSPMFDYEDGTDSDE